jgi:hypothetical protein
VSEHDCPFIDPDTGHPCIKIKGHEVTGHPQHICTDRAIVPLEQFRTDKPPGVFNALGANLPGHLFKRGDTLKVEFTESLPVRVGADLPVAGQPVPLEPTVPPEPLNEPTDLPGTVVPFDDPENELPSVRLIKFYGLLDEDVPAADKEVAKRASRWLRKDETRGSAIIRGRENAGLKLADSVQTTTERRKNFLEGFRRKQAQGGN